MRESEIEKRVSQHAANAGWLTIKLMSVNKRGMPDRLFIRRRLSFFVEFKSGKNGVISSSQKQMAETLVTKYGVPVYFISTVEDGYTLVDAYTLKE